MSYFSPEYLNFFRDLSANNTKEWFDVNRKIYEKEVKKPFAAFIDEMIQRIQVYEPEVFIKPSDAIMRINKDIRFSKDKTPYNTYMAANISAFGKKDKSYPGIYFQLSHEKVMIYGGAYMVGTPTLLKIRRYIADNTQEFSSIYNGEDFKSKFGSIQGEKHKRLPEEFQSLLSTEPLIANKQFYYGAELGPDIILKKDLPERLMEYYSAGKELNHFLITAIKN